MGRKVKCRACGTELDTITAFKLIEHDTNDKEKRFYFCSRDEYLKYEEDKRKAFENKEKFYRLFCEILGVNGITNTALWKEKAEINKVFSDDVIIGYLEENKEWIANTIGRLDGNIYGKIRYISTILKNQLGDYKPKVKEIETPKIKVDTSSFELFEPTTKKQELESNFILEDVEDDLL